MKKNYILVSLIFLAFFFQKLQAQNNFKSGFIITTKSDTVYGYINDKVDYKLSVNIEFKSELSGSVTKFTTNDIVGFQFKNGRRFERVSEKSNDSYIFGKKSIQGKIDLFIVNKAKGSKSEFYLRNNEIKESVYLMPPKKRKFTKNGKEYVTKSNSTFNGRLMAIKEDSSNYKPIKYKTKLIKKSIVNYNKNNNHNYPYELIEEDIVTSYEISVGSGWASERDGTGMFRINVTKNTMNRDRNRKVSFFQAVNYSQYRNEYNIYGEPDTSYEEMYYTLRVIPFGFKFQTDTENLIPYFFTGIGLGIGYLNDELDEGDRFAVFPTISLGVGLKAKIGSNYIFAELTPQLIEGLFLNLGYSF